MISNRASALIAASIFLMLTTVEASACSCGSSTTEEQFSKADLVVKGRMKTVTYGIDQFDPESNEWYRMTRGEFEVKSVLKGAFTEKTISIYTGSGLGDCGRLGDFLTAAYRYHDEKLSVIELGLMKSEFAGQTVYVTTICDYAKYPKGNEE